MVEPLDQWSVLAVASEGCGMTSLAIDSPPPDDALASAWTAQAASRPTSPQQQALLALEWVQLYVDPGSEALASPA